MGSHFKLGQEVAATYSVDGSVCHIVRKTYKQLSMMEDALVLTRLTRFATKAAHLVDVEVRTRRADHGLSTYG